MRGGRRAKDKLLKEFCIRLCSADEVGKYVKEKLNAEMVEEPPVRLKGKVGGKTLPRRKVKLMVKKG